MATDWQTDRQTDDGVSIIGPRYLGYETLKHLSNYVLQIVIRTWPLLLHARIWRNMFKRDATYNLRERPSSDMSSPFCFTSLLNTASWLCMPRSCGFGLLILYELALWTVLWLNYTLYINYSKSYIT